MVSFSGIGLAMWEALKEILKSPFKDLSIWWFLGPIFLLWITLELYFGEHKKERLGWNTSLANGITLFWVGIESMRFLFSTKPESMWLKFAIICFIILYSGFVIYITFTHKFSGNITYILAGPSPIYFLSAVTILWGHGALILTWWVILDLVLLFGFFLGMFTLIRKFMPESAGDESDGLSSNLGGLGSEPGTGEIKL